MDIDSIRFFLAVVDTGSISSASALLYTSQSNISRKISGLEKELNVTLMTRGKGLHSISLTPQGEAFLKSARQMDILARDMESLSQYPGREYLSIGATESTNVFYFADFYASFIRNHPEICVSLHTYHSTNIYHKLTDHTVDIGYVCFMREYPDLITNILSEGDYVVVTGKDSPYYENISIHSLPDEKEIYMRYSEEYEIWHNNIFPGKRYLMRLSDELSVMNYLSVSGAWMVTRESFAKKVCDGRNVVYYHLSDMPMKSSIYESVHRYIRPSRTRAVEVFRKELHDYLKNDNDI
ncbi:MAG: LysR family transcriptional regulator [Erysipelotrichaceae bacterium]|nr:LysR family transcriptional regulator [Erysipelotrichaceae bacterium]MBE6130089.1 LysR family transcriptional regulator [Erysipelotrichaceae bacterium]